MLHWFCRTNPASGISNRKPEQGLEAFPCEVIERKTSRCKDFQNQEEGTTKWEKLKQTN
jgi:hypothetical protein